MAGWQRMGHGPHGWFDPSRTAADFIKGLVLAALEFQTLTWAEGGTLEKEKIDLAQSLDFGQPQSWEWQLCAFSAT